MHSELSLAVSEFVALLNQSLEMAYPSVLITGELANMRVSKGKWLYFDLKDEYATVKFFGTVYNLPGPLEDGMMLQVRGTPRLHNQYGFSVNVQHIQPAGEGSIRKAAELLAANLAKEGLFDETRKRRLPYPPERIGLITSAQSAAYADFMKILSARWSGMTIELIDVQVQGEAAPEQIVAAIEQFNERAYPPEVLVLIRGGGSAEDLAAFSTEHVTRAVAASRVPTLVAIGHEVDVSLAELAADRRASTPSNAAELLTPDKTQSLVALKDVRMQLRQQLRTRLHMARHDLAHRGLRLGQITSTVVRQQQLQIDGKLQLLNALSPTAVLARGFAIVRSHEGLIRGGSQLSAGAIVNVELLDSEFTATVNKVIPKGT
ncbi:MAG TPA: exodeoxyribonuclease VII large subunit [Candidatus Saccharimonadales bacterium]|nr:exodeoxyribonuclease VII large subunit [Candidatus Saccharimonadales bacterium]